MANEKVKEILEEYKSIVKEKLGISEPIPVNDEGKIILAGKRWVMMDVSYFPAFMTSVTEEVVGPIAKEFVYWFGYAYGEKTAERYEKTGIPKEQQITITFAFAALYTGWGISKIEELDLDKPYMRTAIFNDFETESAEAIGAEPDLKFLSGVLAGVFGRLTKKKIKVQTSRKDDGSLIVEYLERK
ncbi:MAG: XylR N-terminal domain-containing protein [Caldisericaceae bacterium]|nr:XylR N-terminal domain-containing protein [Caldisericaceae bacterium]